MSDLFTQPKRAQAGSPISDQECQIWAERLMRDVNEDVSREHLKERDFIQAWIRWTDLVKLVNFMDLSLYRRANIDGQDLTWHRTLTSGLVALGSAIQGWAKNFSPQTLELASFDSHKLETMIQSVKASLEDFHSDYNPKLTESIEALLPP